MRESLQQLAYGQPPGEADNQQQGQANTRQSGQPGQQQQAGQSGQPQAGQQGQQSGQPGGQQAQQAGGAAAGGDTGRLAAGGVNGGGYWWNRGLRGALPSRDLRDQVQNNVARSVRDIRSLIPRLRDQGADDTRLDEIRRLTEQLEAANFDANDKILQEQMNAALALAEKLEMEVSRSASGEEDSRELRAASSEPVPTEFRDAVAEYYRKLSGGAAQSDSQ